MSSGGPGPPGPGSGSNHPRCYIGFMIRKPEPCCEWLVRTAYRVGAHPGSGPDRGHGDSESFRVQGLARRRAPGRDSAQCPRSLLLNLRNQSFNRFLFKFADKIHSSAEPCHPGTAAQTPLFVRVRASGSGSPRRRLGPPTRKAVGVAW